MLFLAVITARGHERSSGEGDICNECQVYDKAVGEGLRACQHTQRCIQAAENVFVTPAKAGVQDLIPMVSSTFWIPASAGMTEFDIAARLSASC
jgi:hypothetical protein